MSMKEILLIDLSSIAFPIWHMSAAEPDPNAASQKIVARVRALANHHPHVAVCCDKGRSFRHEIAPTYKANRPPQEAPLHHQIALAVETLEADGFPVWAVKGFEADDVIASAAAKALADEHNTVLIASADKDLLQLISPRVRAISVRDGSIVDIDAVQTKFGVTPEQMRDYLTLVGDASDNVKGVKGIGPKKAADLLTKYGSLDAVYQQLTDGGAAMGLQLAMSAALREFKPSLDQSRQLLTLRTDVELPFDEVLQPRAPKDLVPFIPFDEGEDMENDTPAPETTTAAPDAETPTQQTDTNQPLAEAPRTGPTTLVTREAEVLAPPPAEWERQLDPRSLKEVRIVATDLFNSRLFSAYGTPQGVLSTIMVGRELGLPALSSLRAIHVIEGRHSLSAAIMVALVLRSGLAEFFEPIEFNETTATYETKRKGARQPVKLTHTIQMAHTAGLVKPNSNWTKTPIDMLVARCQARLARMVYPDLLAGLYTPEELAEIREQVA